MAQPIIREAVRALILDGEHLLLQQILKPDDRTEFWITPGGAVDGSESDHEALLRELHEELGVASLTIGPCVWVRRHRFTWSGRDYDQRERFYLIEAQRFEARPAFLQEEELNTILGHRWWRTDEISASTAVFAPRALGRELTWLIEHGPPPSPLDVGV